MAENINNFLSDAENIIKDFAKRRRKYLESLMDLPYKNEVITLAEFNQLRFVNSLLAVTIKRYEKEIKSLESVFGKDGEKNFEGFARAKGSIEQKILTNAMATLDKLNRLVAK